MTNTTDIVPPSTLPADDPRLALAKAVALAGDVIRGVHSGELSATTPCSEFNVRQLLGHMVGALRRTAAVGRGEDPTSIPFVIEDVPDGAWADAWTGAAHEVQAAWSDRALLTKQIQLPWASMPGAVVMGIYTSEITVHTWDLATATGQRPTWDDGTVSFGFDTVRAALPAEPRGGQIPFDPPIAVPDGAPLIDQLIGWTGRRP